MLDIEHPDITHVNKTGFTQDQWRELHKKEREESDNEGDE